MTGTVQALLETHKSTEWQQKVGPREGHPSDCPAWASPEWGLLIGQRVLGDRNGLPIDLWSFEGKRKIIP